ncbi:MAG: DUF2207 domain-containing protein [Candidatus Diapherotrites archaeon]
MQKKYLIFLILIAIALPFVQSKSFYIENAYIKCKINTDGLLEVEEKITVYFKGSFSEGFREIKSDGIEIYGVTVLVNNEPTNVKTFYNADKFRIDWSFSAADESKTFTIKYKVKKAVEAYDDVAQLAWIVWSGEWGVPLKELQGEIELPNKVADPKEVYTYGHPALQDSEIGLVENLFVFFRASTYKLDKM